MRIMKFLIGLLFCCGFSPINCCTIVINEIKSSFQDDTKPNLDFIELKAVGCRSKEKPAMKFFSLVRLTASINLNDFVRAQQTCNFHADLVVNFYHAKFRTNSDYFVIGSDALESSEITVDMKFSSNSIASKEKITGRAIQQTLTELQNGTGVRMHDKKYINVAGFFLLRASKSTDLPKISLDSTGKSAISDSLKENMQRLMHDGIVFSQNFKSLPHTDYHQNVLANCAVRLQDLVSAWSSIKNAHFILREKDDSNGQDFSLNRCPVAENQKKFFFSCFKRGTPSPGRRNDCDGPSLIFDDTETTASNVDDHQNREPVEAAVQPGSESNIYT
jgi:hypothetical protein